MQLLTTASPTAPPGKPWLLQPILDVSRVLQQNPMFDVETSMFYFLRYRYDLLNLLRGRSFAHARLLGAVIELLSNHPSDGDVIGAGKHLLRYSYDFLNFVLIHSWFYNLVP